MNWVFKSIILRCSLHLSSIAYRHVHYCKYKSNSGLCHCDLYDVDVLNVVSQVDIIPTKTCNLPVECKSRCLFSCYTLTDACSSVLAILIVNWLVHRWLTFMILNLPVISQSSLNVLIDGQSTWALVRK